MGTSTTDRPADPTAFGAMDCGDGIAITRAGLRYEVHVGDRFAAAADSLHGAMAKVEMVRAGIGGDHADA